MGVNNLLNKQLAIFSAPFKKWVDTHYLQLAVFNATLLLLVLLRSAGYFEPLFPLSINFIIFTAIILSVFILGARSKVLFCIAICFLLVSIPFRVIGYLEVWAERTVVYAFEAIVIGLIVFIVESIKQRND